MSRNIENTLIGEVVDARAFNLLLPSSGGELVVATLKRFHNTRPQLASPLPGAETLFQQEKPELLKNFLRTNVILFDNASNIGQSMDFKLSYLLDSRFEVLIGDFPKMSALKSLIHESFSRGYSLERAILDMLPTQSNAYLTGVLHNDLLSCIFYEAALIGLRRPDLQAKVRPLTETYYKGNPCVGLNTQQKDVILLAA